MLVAYICARSLVLQHAQGFYVPALTLRIAASVLIAGHCQYIQGDLPAL